MGGPAGSRADVARLLRGISSRLADTLFPLLVLAGLAYIDLLQHRQWYVTVPAVMALAGVVIYRRELAALLRPVLPKSSLARATLFRLAIAAAGLSYFLARGRGPLSVREAYLVALPVVGLGLALAALGKWLDKALGVVYRVRDRVLRPRVREVAAVAVAWVAVFTLSRPSRSSLTQHDVSGVLNAALISVAAVYLLLRELGVGHVGLAEMLGGIRWLPRKRGVRLAVSLVVLGAVTAALTYPLWRPGPGPVAAPDYILDQARRLGFDADRIAAFVRDDVPLDEYEGVLRGAVGTLWAGTGNELDRALLLEALLNRSGIPTRLVQGETVGVEIQSAGGGFSYVGPSLSSDPGATPIDEIPGSLYHVAEVVLRTWSADGSSVTDESIAFRTADLIGRDIRIFYRPVDGATVAVVHGRGGELVSKADAATSQRQEVVFGLSGPGTEAAERSRELFTRALGEEFPSVFHPTNRYTVVVTAVWVPASVREREAGWAGGWENQHDATAHRVAYSFLSLSDENSRSMMAETGVSARFDSPRVIMVSDEAIPVAGTRSLSLDLRKNDIAVESDPAGVAFSSLRSLYDASLESFVLRRETGQPATSAADVLANAFGELGSTPSERHMVLRDALARLLREEPEGASLIVAPEGRDQYFIRFERKGSGLAVSASKVLPEALPEDTEEVRSLFTSPVGPADDLGAVVRKTEFALVATAGLPVNYRQEYAYSPAQPERWYEGSRILYFGQREGPGLSTAKVELGQPQTLAVWAIRTSDFDEPAHPRMAADGTVFFTSYADVGRLDPMTGALTTWPIGIELNGLAVDETGAVWAVLTFGGELVRLDPSTGEKTVVLGPRIGLNHLTSTGSRIYAGYAGGIVAIEAASYTHYVEWNFDATVADLQVVGGRIHFTDDGTNSVGILDPAARTITRWEVPTGESGVNGIYVDEATGNIYFTERDVDKVGRLDPRGGLITEWALPREGVEPLHLKRGRDGRIFVTGRGSGSLFALDPSRGGTTHTVRPTVVRVEPETVRAGEQETEVVKASTYQARRFEVTERLASVGGFLELPLPSSSPHDLTPDGGVWRLQEGRSHTLARSTRAGRDRKS